ncbi:MAG: VTT domain-containing protein [Beijerinckiaceae bacterium]|nr:VTT domain-containing protein [Beijerinckiaceae bacterium]
MTKEGHDRREDAPGALPGAGAAPARSPWLRLAPLAILALALAAALASGAANYLTLDNLLASREALAGLISRNLLVALLAFILAYAAIVAASIPGATLFTLSGGLLFGGWLGGAAAIVGATAGATLLFLAARSSLGAVLAQRAGPKIERFRAGFQKDAVSYLLFLRLVSVFPFWLVNLALAMTGVKLWTFVWTTFVGIMPATLAFALAGAGLGSIADRKQQAYEACLGAKGPQGGCSLGISPQDLVTRETLIAITALGIMALIPAVLRRLRRPPTRETKMSEADV